MERRPAAIPYERFTQLKGAPKLGAKFIVVRNLKRLVENAIRDIQEFTHTSFVKGKGLEQLKHLILLAEQHIAEHLESIFKVLASVLHSEVENNERVVLQIAELIGYVVSEQVSIPLVLNMLASEELRQSTKLSTNLLTVFARVIGRCDEQKLEPYRRDLFGLLQTYTALYRDNNDGMVALLVLCQQFLQVVAQINSGVETNSLFDLLLQIQATRSITPEHRNQASNAMSMLAKKCGYVSISELHSNEIGPVLESYVRDKTYSKWNKTSKERFKFDTIVRNCHEAVAKFMPLVLEIIQYCIGHQNDLEIRIDTLVLVEHILGIQQLRSTLMQFGEQLIKNVLVPSIQWKVGKPQIKIRKAGIINIINLIDRRIVSSMGLLNCYNELLPPLKNCLTDDWAPQLRLASCQLVQKILELTQEDISDDQLRQLYPSLIERLDDAQDPNRMKISQAINFFFHCPALKKTPTIFEYVMQGVFIHFDDNNEDIQDAMMVTLKHASAFDAKKVLTHATSARQKMKNTAKCEYLIEYCQERLE